MLIWRVVGAIHRALYVASGGWIGARLGGRDMLLLTTRGRRTGKPRTLPLAYLREGRHLVVVASNSGSDRHPAWWLNLEKEPGAEVRAGRERFLVRAARASPEERAALWPRLCAYNPAWDSYQQDTQPTPWSRLRP